MASIAIDRRAAAPAISWLDAVERVAVLAIFVSFALRNFHAIVDRGQLFNIVVVASEALVATFVLIRRTSSDVTRRPLDWMLAFGATIGPLLTQAVAHARPLAPEGIGVPLLLMGFGLQLWAKLVLRRSFGIVPANRGVKASGPYRFVRHPMYLGYVTVHIGFLLLAPSLLNVCIYVASFVVQLFRILAEERLLCTDPAYEAYRSQTRWRLLPGVF
jgi:protein-S-isoprenylcysteine O-methyltransferase Ste14